MTRNCYLSSLFPLPSSLFPEEAPPLPLSTYRHDFYTVI
ncbi:hypothetical protein CKA32_006126 [Geitlerinema sp. FC II]|nr:hypothetical protein CKA32_006126 [Geitlerinema sp. FC II]